MSADTAFPVAFVALYVAHVVGDHWVQTETQARRKGEAGWSGRRAATWHVATLSATALLTLVLVAAVLGTRFDPSRLAAGLAVNGVSHWWADRRWTLAWLAVRAGKSSFAALGGPLGGAYQLDQAWHVAWLLVAALVISG